MALWYVCLCVYYWMFTVQHVIGWMSVLMKCSAVWISCTYRWIYIHLCKLLYHYTPYPFPTSPHPYPPTPTILSPLPLPPNPITFLLLPNLNPLNSLTITFWISLQSSLSLTTLHLPNLSLLTPFLSSPLPTSTAFPPYTIYGIELLTALRSQGPTSLSFG